MFPRPAFVAIADLDRALRFCRDTLGLTFIGDEPLKLIFRTDDGIGLRLSKVTQLTPAPPPSP